MAEGWERFPRANPPALEAERRATSLDIVEVNYSETQARHQASRCLRCNVNTVFDTSICVACNGCVDVCPENLIRLVPLSRLVEDDNFLASASAELGVAGEQLRALPAEELDALGGVMMKDEKTCIRCAMCATRCPTHAITMKHFQFTRECVTVPTPNPKVLYQ